MSYTDAEISLMKLRAGRTYNRLELAEREASKELLRAIDRREGLPRPCPHLKAKPLRGVQAASLDLTTGT